jgi:putative mRNA 3-end processing factor
VGGEVWVVSGDYKLAQDGLSEPFEPVRAHTFVSECTFGLPVFRWAPQAEVAAEILGWWQDSLDQGRRPLLGAYALGKAQRLLAMLADGPGPILTHGAVEEVTQVLRDQGYALPPTLRVTADLDPKAHPDALVLAPPSALGSRWARRFGPVSTALASGWMRLRGVRRRRAADRGFVISDHADWPDLLRAIGETGAEKVYVTHGYTEVFSQYLKSRGQDVGIVRTEFGASADDDGGDLG